MSHLTAAPSTHDRALGAPHRAAADHRPRGPRRRSRRSRPTTSTWCSARSRASRLAEERHSAAPRDGPPIGAVRGDRARPPHPRGTARRSPRTTPTSGRCGAASSPVSVPARGDLVVASEPYGAELAAADRRYVPPLRPGRMVNGAKASRVRDEPIEHCLRELLDEFQPYVRKRVTLFGAESVGKSDHGAAARGARAAPSRSRSGLARTSSSAPSVPGDHPRRCARSGRASSPSNRPPRRSRPADAGPSSSQDTDLFSTVGYWLLKGADFGEPEVPPGLVGGCRPHTRATST